MITIITIIILTITKIIIIIIIIMKIPIRCVGPPTLAKIPDLDVDVVVLGRENVSHFVISCHRIFQATLYHSSLAALARGDSWLTWR